MRSWNFSVNVSELARVIHRDLDLQCGDVMRNFRVTRYSHCYWSDIRYPFVIRYPIVLKCTHCSCTVMRAPLLPPCRLTNLLNIITCCCCLCCCCLCCCCLCRCCLCSCCLCRCCLCSCCLCPCCLCPCCLCSCCLCPCCL